MSRDWVERVRSLLDGPAPAVLTTYRKDGSAHTVPVWFRWSDDAFEVVRPFRGVEVCGVGELVEGEVTSARAAIAGRYLGLGDGVRFAADRRSAPGVLLRLVPDSPRVWDLSGILPASWPFTAAGGTGPRRGRRRRGWPGGDPGGAR